MITISPYRSRFKSSFEQNILYQRLLHDRASASILVHIPASAGVFVHGLREDYCIETRDSFVVRRDEKTTSRAKSRDLTTNIARVHRRGSAFQRLDRQQGSSDNDLCPPTNTSKHHLEAFWSHPLLPHLPPLSTPFASRQRPPCDLIAMSCPPQYCNPHPPQPSFRKPRL